MKRVCDPQKRILCGMPEWVRRKPQEQHSGHLGKLAESIPAPLRTLQRKAPYPRQAHASAHAARASQGAQHRLTRPVPPSHDVELSFHAGKAVRVPGAGLGAAGRVCQAGPGRLGRVVDVQVREVPCRAVSKRAPTHAFRMTAGTVQTPEHDGMQDQARVIDVPTRRWMTQV